MSSACQGHFYFVTPIKKMTSFLPELVLYIFWHEGSKAHEGKDNEDRAEEVPDIQLVGHQPHECILNRDI